jgi:hypothetical protein
VQAEEACHRFALLTSFASAGVVGTHGTATSSMALGFYAKQARACVQVKLIQPRLTHLS